MFARGVKSSRDGVFFLGGWATKSLYDKKEKVG